MIGSADRKGAKALLAAKPMAVPAGPTGKERRRARRIAVGWHARVVIGQAPSVECAVLNVSLRGAKLRLRLPIDLPGGFTLSIPRFGDFSVEVMEQQQAIVRVAFLDPPEAIQRLFRGQLPPGADDGPEA